MKDTTDWPLKMLLLHQTKCQLSLCNYIFALDRLKKLKMENYLSVSLTAAKPFTLEDTNSHGYETESE